MKNQFKYRVYKNLHRGDFSILSNGKVIDRGDNLILTNVQFYSRETGRQRVIEEGVKNVHAFMCSNDPILKIDEASESTIDRSSVSHVEITYNPKWCSKFFATLEPSRNYQFEPEWVIPKVYTQDGKLFMSKEDLYNLLHEKTDFKDLVKKIFFKDDAKYWHDLENFLKALIEDKQYIQEDPKVDVIGSENAYSLDQITGLCSNLDNNIGTRYIDHVDEFLRFAFKKWEHFSGNINYPIDDSYSVKMENPKTTYKSGAYSYDTLPLYTGEYGEKRFELAQHLLDLLQK